MPLRKRIFSSYLFPVRERFTAWPFIRHIEICPPIPAEHKSRFSINGQLMQGYTVAAKEREHPDQGQVDALLDCLDDVDMLEVPTLVPKKQHPQKEKHTIKKKHSLTR